MASVNTQLQDAAIAHQIDIIRYSNGVVNRIIALLNRTDADLFQRIIDALNRMPEGGFTVERLDSMLASVRELNQRAYQQVREGIQGELYKLVEYEANYQQQLFTNTIPVNVEVASVSVQQVYSAALARPFQGRLLSEWASSIEAEKMAKIRDAIRIGFVEGETIPQIVTRLRGTKARQYEDGIIGITRRNAEAVVRTAVSHTANHTRQKFYEANNDLIKGVQWVATLDSRTSPICQSRDGTIYPVDSGPRPPAHFNCRSTTVPITKSFKELGIDLPEADKSTRASMDGQVPEDTTYQQWLKGKSAAFQDEVLGKSKGKLFRAGMPLDKFVNRAGDTLTLDELRAKNADYFKKAGL